MQANASADWEFDDEGDVIMKIMRQLTITGNVATEVPVAAAEPAPAPAAALGPQATYKINYQLNLFYVHTFDNYEEGGASDAEDGYAPDPYDPDSLPGLDCQYCDDDACSCSGYEFPLNDFELDTYMQDGDRYKKFARAIMKRWASPESVLGREAIADIEYKKGGRLSFNLYYKCSAITLPTDETLVDDLQLAPFETTIYREEPGTGCGAVVPSKHKYGPAGAGQYLERGLIDCRADKCVHVKNMGMV